MLCCFLFENFRGNGQNVKEGLMELECELKPGRLAGFHGELVPAVGLMTLGYGLCRQSILQAAIRLADSLGNV